MNTRPWHAHYDPWVVRHPEYPHAPLTDILDRAAARDPGGVAIEFGAASISFDALRVQADRLAGALRDRGVAAGDRVGIMLPNCPPFVMAVFATLRAGAVVVPINPAYTAREIEFVVRDAGLRALITLDTRLAAVHVATAETPISLVVATTLAEYGGEAKGAPPVSPVAGATPLAGLLSHTSTFPTPFPRRSPDDVAVLQYTGGTTGRPKAAVLTHASIFANVIQSVAFMYGAAPPERERYLLVIPLFHTYGFTVGMLRALWIGATQRLVPSFHPDQVLDAIAEFQPDFFPAVPTIYVSLLSHPRVATSGLNRVRVCNTGGAPCALHILNRFEQVAGRPLSQGYGLTEASPALCSTPQLGMRRPGTVGIPLPDTDVRIVDLDTGRPAPAGHSGELWVSGPQLMQGYWRQPDETARVLRTDADGRRWLRTGDIARMDADGFLTIVQRLKDVIIVDALKVYPSEVESVLMTYPGVAMAAAIGLPDAYHGEVVHASVVPTSGATLSPDELLCHCRAHLAPFKVPAQIDIRAALPMSSVGKVLYRVLRQELSAAEVTS
ncbi:MAG: long-chain fatty acid--CoA ligase [Vicinamibacterales bacterium]